MSNGNDEYGQFGKIFGNPPRSNPMGPFGSEEGYLPYDRETMDIQQALDAIKASMPGEPRGLLDSIGLFAAESLPKEIIEIIDKYGFQPSSEIPQSKAHDNIDNLIDMNEHKDLLMNLITGGGIGGTIKTGLNLGKTGSKIISDLNVLDKIKARNLKGLENLKKSKVTGQASMKGEDRAFFREEMERLKNLFK